MKRQEKPKKTLTHPQRLVLEALYKGAFITAHTSPDNKKMIYRLHRANVADTEVLTPACKIAELKSGAIRFIGVQRTPEIGYHYIMTKLGTRLFEQQLKNKPKQNTYEIK